MAEVTKDPQGEAVQVQQIIKEPQQIMKEPQGKATQVQRVTTKNAKTVEAGKMLVENNHKKREVKKQVKLETSGVNQYYGIGAVLALGVIGGLALLLHLLVQERRATK